jgi:hypothetical protein
MFTYNITSSTDLRKEEKEKVMMSYVKLNTRASFNELVQPVLPNTLEDDVS